MKRLLLIAAAIALLFGAGCKKESNTPKDGTGSGTASKQPGSAGGTAATKAPGKAPATKGTTEKKADDKKALDLPTEQDFEAKAHQEITKKNLAKELKKIENSLKE